jgi:hypothetical protein
MIVVVKISPCVFDEEILQLISTLSLSFERSLLLLLPFEMM